MDSNQSAGQSFMTTIIHEIKNTIRGEPHTFSEIRSTIEEARLNETDIFQIISEHHRFLNESVVILLDRDSSTVEKQIHLDRLLQLFDMHSRAEEETLYRSLARHTDHEVKRAGLVGIDEHEIAHNLADELEVSGFLSQWTDDIDAKAQVFATLLSNHMLEEEGVVFPVARKALLPGELLVLASDYLDLCEFELDGDARQIAPTFLTWPLDT